MRLLRTLQGGRKSRRVQEQLDEALLVFDGQADDVGLIDGPVRDLLSSGDYEIADTAALELCRALDDPERIGGNTSFDPRGAASFLGHRSRLSLTYCTGFCRTPQCGPGG